MRYISARPTRLFCPTCEEIYSLPQGGDVKLYSGAVRPLDAFELVTFTLSGRDGKRYALCPFCYNHPPFEDLAKPGDTDKPGGFAAPVKPQAELYVCHLDLYMHYSLRGLYPYGSMLPVYNKPIV